MNKIINALTSWVLKLQGFLATIEYTEILGYVLLFADAILSALFTEMLFKDKRKEKKTDIWRSDRVVTEKKGSYLSELFLFFVVSLFVFFLNICITLLLMKLFLHFVPQEESFEILVKRIYDSYHTKFLLPLIATIIAGLALKGVTWDKKWAKSLLCILLAVSAVANSFTFLWDSVKVIQRPHYEPPVESISAIINSRLKVYPFILSGQLLRSIGDGSELIETADAAEIDSGGSFEQTVEEYEEPNSFKGYLDAIMNEQYALGKGAADYVVSAYRLYKEGRHGNNFEYIGMMWYYLYFYIDFIENETDITPEICLENALENYDKSLNEKESWATYYNKMLIYGIQGNREKIRECMKKIIDVSEDDETKIECVSFYLDYVYKWIDDEPTELLLEDAKMITQYKEDLSMYILYGACAVAENRDVEGAYMALCKADEHFQGKNVLVKILRCICADLLSRNDTVPLYDIYQTEKTRGLTVIEESYLIRYLLGSGRYDELWGYIDDVGNDGEKGFSVEKAVIKAGWYFDNQNKSYSDVDGMEKLLNQISERLKNNSYTEEQKNLLLLSSSLLRNCLGKTEEVAIEEYDVDQITAIEYVFCATNAFNNADYDLAISYCESFIDEKDDEVEELVKTSLQELTPQEQVTLRYYMQLIYAHSHFECSKRYRKDSEEWNNHMNIAEKECAVFEKSAKSFLYIEDRFEELRGIIYKERGELEIDGDKIIIEDA